MTGDNQELIEAIRRANEDTLKAIIEAFVIEDPIERFRSIDNLEVALNDPTGSVLRIAKARTLRELRDNRGLSMEGIGQLLGVSRQRVHQLMNPR